MIFILRCSVGALGFVHQAKPVDDNNLAAIGADEPLALQDMNRNRNPGAPHAEHG